ncbi:hypothetical protein [Streptomyces camelliae]|uniref:Transposase n=1 Tax=Streptomyces camelliae TaxID=3004093 RepID=A0ABY7PFK9_9ACTN|nr:hypothetical protein [Streptomyces sp. HUAS 2-6]WBO68352.1 hypothetical protein O1G22_38820 [Streptomyces sp. HUAS 2-6]
MSPPSTGAPAGVGAVGGSAGGSAVTVSMRRWMVAYVRVRGVRTVYDRIGDTCAWLCLAASAALTATTVVRPRRPAHR